METKRSKKLITSAAARRKHFMKTTELLTPCQLEWKYIVWGLGSVASSYTIIPIPISFSDKFVG
jgi:hypothetical protein